MTSFALALVLAAAVFHATWNLFAKRVGDGGAPFVWIFGALSAIIYAPLAVVVVLYERPHFGPAEVLFMCGSGVLHLGYFLLLQRGYATGDLSLIYPLSRGTGPLLSTAAAIALLGERPSALALCGVALIAVGVFLLTREPGHTRGAGFGRAVVYGLLTGGFIAAYTLWDKHAVSALLIPPLLQRVGPRSWLPRLYSPRWRCVTGGRSGRFGGRTGSRHSASRCSLHSHTSWS